MCKIFDNKFDIIISIGEDCACTSYLRRFNLQKHSYPFDWLTNASFETRINCLINNFDRFLDFVDLKQMPKPNAFNPDENHDYYENIYNGFYFWHDFPIGIPINDSYQSVTQKYERRIKRLYSDINKSKTILFVWLSMNKQQSQDVLEQAYIQLKNKFVNKEVYLLIAENCEKEEYKYLKDGHILITKYDTSSWKHNPEWNAAMGNEENNMHIFSQISLNYTLSSKFKDSIYLIIKFLINLIPSKELRHKYRESLDFCKNHAKL